MKRHCESLLALSLELEGIVVAVVEFDGQRLYHQKEHSRLALLLLVPHFLSIARVCSEVQPFPVCAHWCLVVDVKVFTM